MIINTKAFEYLCAVIFTTFLTKSCEGFVHPTSRSFVTKSATGCQQNGPMQMHMLPSFTLSDEQAVSAVTSVVDPSSVDSGVFSQLAEGLQTVAIGITAVIFLIAGLTLITANFIVPQAAKQLEEETRALRPDLWDAYQAKLGEGETLVNRPDLLQELGNIMQPIILANAEEQARQQAGVSPMQSPPPSVTTTVDPPTFSSVPRSDSSEMDSLRQQFDNNSMGSFDAEIVDEKRDGKIE